LTDAHVPTTVPSPPPVASLIPIRIAIFVATVWEFAAVRAAVPGGRMDKVQGQPRYCASAGGGECWVIQTGVGPKRAHAAAQAVLSRQTFALAVSSGFACALIPAAIGDILIGTKAATIRNGGSLDYLEVEGDERQRWCTILSGSEALACTTVGSFISADRIVYRAAEKVALAERTHATGLDMESAALASEAKAAQVPFLIVRSVSDLLLEELPLDFNLFLRPTGWVKGVGALLAHPSSLLGLNRLRRQSAVAAAALTKILRIAVNARFGVRPDSPMTMTR
jgi:adenosylhomocysteine nucleosidase